MSSGVNQNILVGSMQEHDPTSLGPSNFSISISKAFFIVSAFIFNIYISSSRIHLQRRTIYFIELYIFFNNHIIIFLIYSQYETSICSSNISIACTGHPPPQIGKAKQFKHFLRLYGIYSDKFLLYSDIIMSFGQKTDPHIRSS